MSIKPYDTIVPHEKRRSLPFFTKLIALVAVSFLTACVQFQQAPTIIEPPKEPEPIVVPVSPYSNEPIVRAKTTDIRFAQQALTDIGYKIGPVDGLWGPWSAKGIRRFEADKELPSADGHLSERNLHELEVASGLSRETFNKNIALAATSGIKHKLSKKEPLSAGPQLIIVDQDYTVLSKPNPYSSELLKLAAGAGIYVISKQGGYFEIEYINRKRGYILAD